LGSIVSGFASCAICAVTAGFSADEVSAQGAAHAATTGITRNYFHELTARLPAGDHFNGCHGGQGRDGGKAHPIPASRHLTSWKGTSRNCLSRGSRREIIRLGKLSKYRRILRTQAGLLEKRRFGCSPPTLWGRVSRSLLPRDSFQAKRKPDGVWRGSLKVGRQAGAPAGLC
jgi:hypothetical protein